MQIEKNTKVFKSPLTMNNIVYVRSAWFIYCPALLYSGDLRWIQTDSMVTPSPAVSGTSTQLNGKYKQNQLDYNNNTRF